MSLYLASLIGQLLVLSSYSSPKSRALIVCRLDNAIEQTTTIEQLIRRKILSVKLIILNLAITLSTSFLIFDEKN